MTLAFWLAVIVRLIGEAVILGFVWHHAHWSVALSMAWLMANVEGAAIIRKVNQENDQQERERFKWIGRIRDIT